MATRIQRAAGTVEDAVESLADNLSERLGDRLPALAEALGDRFPALSEALGDRFPALGRRQRHASDDAWAFVSGLLFGALVAGVAAVFLAPTDGRTLRARLVERFNTLLGYEAPSPEPIADSVAVSPSSTADSAETAGMPAASAASASAVTETVVVRPPAGPLVVTETTSDVRPVVSPPAAE